MRLVQPVLVATAAAFVVGGLALRGLAQMDETPPASQPAAVDPNAPVAPPSKQTAPKPKMPAKLIKLVQPWSKVTDLTDEQKQQLYDIHEDYKAKMKALELEEKEKSEAVLTDAQKAQLGETTAAEKAEKKLKDAEKRAAEKAEKAAAPK